jgi:hypothetical protein
MHSIAIAVTVISLDPIRSGTDPSNTPARSGATVPREHDLSGGNSFSTSIGGPTHHQAVNASAGRDNIRPAQYNAHALRVATRRESGSNRALGIDVATA